MAHLLEVRDLNVWFQPPHGPEVHAVRGVSLGVDGRQRLGLVGESGCGKSTTLLALMGLLPSNASVSGQVLLDGTDILISGERSIQPHRWRDMAIVFQGAMNAFNPVVRVYRQIADAIEVRGGRSRKEARARAKDLLGMVGVPRDRIEAYPHQFSGGMKQRAAIALALACEPRVLFADEPTTALDVMVQAQVMELLERLCDEQDLALVLVSHDLPLVAEVCERISVMYGGQVVEAGSMEQLRESTRHPYTGLLFAATPDIYDESPLASIPGAPPRLDRAVVGCSFQPRCPRAFDRCVADEPPLRPVDGGQFVACHLSELVAAAEPAAGVTAASDATSGDS